MVRILVDGQWVALYDYYATTSLWRQIDSESGSRNDRQQGRQGRIMSGEPRNLANQRNARRRVVYLRELILPCSGFWPSGPGVFRFGATGVRVCSAHRRAGWARPSVPLAAKRETHGWAVVQNKANLRWGKFRLTAVEERSYEGRARTWAGRKQSQSRREPLTSVEAGGRSPLESRTYSWSTLPAVGCLDSRLRGNDRVVSGGSVFAGAPCETKPIPAAKNWR
jgi:hypothetical protein